MQTAKSTNQAIANFLKERDRDGAFLHEMYPVVNKALGRNVPTTSVQSEIYKRLPSAKGNYTPRSERFFSEGKSKYRLLMSELEK